LHFATDDRATASSSTPESAKAANVPFQGKVCQTIKDNNIKILVAAVDFRSL